MPELRYNIISREWVIIATERAKRPHDFAKSKEEKAALSEYKTDCPFCPGNEDKTPGETFRLGDSKKWQVRVAYNKFPALSPQAQHERRTDGVFRSMDGFGVHEVIIEHPKHNTLMPLMSVEEVSNIIKTYKSRYIELRKINHIEAIIIFKNHGDQAGTSLEHPHSQLVATPIVPPEIRNRVNEAASYFDETGKCVFCEQLEEELKAQKRIVLETASFVSFIPYATLSPFHMWIFPRRHTPSFADINDEEIHDLSLNLRDTLSRLYHGLGNPDFNLTIHSIPLHERGIDYFHWYISVIPRVTKLAGFELGSGIFINVSLPEESAEFLRNVK